MYDPEQAVFEEQPESNIEIAYGIEDVPKRSFLHFRSH